MRVTTRRASDRQQLVFDWTSAAVPATADREKTIINVEDEAANGHERRNPTGGSPVLLGEARPSGNPESGCAPEPFGAGDIDRALARSDRAGHADQGGSGDQQGHAGRPSGRNGDESVGGGPAGTEPLGRSSKPDEAPHTSQPVQGGVTR